MESLAWESGSTPIADLVDAELPMLVRLSESGTDLGPDVDSTSSFLVYSNRRRTKAYGQCVRMVNKKMTQCGPMLEIPKDYTG